MRYRVTYQQRAVVECEFNIEVPAEIVAKGEKAVEEWCDEHETDAQETTTDIVDWNDRVVGTFEVESL